MIDNKLLSATEREWLLQAQESYYLKTHKISTVCKTETADVIFISCLPMAHGNGHVLVLRDKDDLYFRQEVMYSGWRSMGETDESPIQDLISHLRYGTAIRIRIVARPGRNRSVLRFIRNQVTGEWSGWETEEAFQNNGLPVFPFQESGEFPIKILEKTDSMEQELHTVRLKILINMRGRGICRYYIWIPENTVPYDFVEQLNEDTLLSNRYRLHCRYHEACKRLDIISLTPEKQSRRSAKTSLRAGRYSYNFKAMTELSKNYDIVTATESKSPLILPATILDHSRIDYRYSQNRYMLFLLEDGRIIMPPMTLTQTKKKDQAELKQLLNGRTNYLEHRKDLFPGQLVELIFFKSQKSSAAMILKGIAAMDDSRTMQQRKVEYYRDRYVRDGFLPTSHLDYDFSNCTAEELAQYLKSIKCFRQMDKLKFRVKLEHDAQIDPAIDLSMYVNPFME